MEKLVQLILGNVGQVPNIRLVLSIRAPEGANLLRAGVLYRAHRRLSKLLLLLPRKRLGLLLLHIFLRIKFEIELLHLGSEIDPLLRLSEACNPAFFERRFLLDLITIGSQFLIALIEVWRPFPLVLIVLLRLLLLLLTFLSFLFLHLVI